jgi:cation diffusion facilitator CzcD-associated flavoprotein CzcO
MRSATDLFGPSGTPTVVIVGAGMGGITAGVLLRKAGIDTFTIYEKSERVGGTWWDNQYPGAEVDVDSFVYSFPFKRYDWTRTHARQPELHRYFEETVDDFGLASHLRLGTGVQRAVWDDVRHVYRLTLSDGEQTECHVLISAVGFLNVPRYPDWPGLDDFEGPCFHTSRWEHQHDLTGKTVAVVGTGSTASQLVPTLQPTVGKLYLFQREPGWVIPKGDRDFTERERQLLHNPIVYRFRRAKWFWGAEKRLWNGGVYRPGSPINTASEQAARHYIAKVFEDRPDLAKAVTPDYPFWGKRIIFSSDFYPALKQPNVELVPRAVASVTPKGVVDIDGVEREVDVLVLSTGFQPTNYLAHLEVVGREGRTLHEYWDGEPRAFLGITVPTFPNFYMLYGPGTNGGEIALNLRNQAAHARRAIRRMVREGVTAIEVKRSWADPYHAWLMAKMEDTAWKVSNNYFTTSQGKIVTQWPFSALDYGAMVKIMGPLSESARTCDEAADGPDADALSAAELHEVFGTEPLQHERW